MPKRGSREIVVNRDGGYWVRSKTSSRDRDSRRRSTRNDSPQRPSQSYNNMIIVEDAEHGQTVYHAPPSQAPVRRERSYSESQLPPRRPKEDRSRRREPTIVEAAPLPSKSRRRDASPSSDYSDSPQRSRREKSPRRARRLSFDEKTKQRPEKRPSRAAPAPPPPPPYQPPAYAQLAPAQPYYGQPMMEPPRAGNVATRFGRKLGNAAIFGVGFTAGADLLNSII